MNHPWKSTDDWFEDVRENGLTNSWNGEHSYEEAYSNAALKTAKESQIIESSGRGCQHHTKGGNAVCQVSHACQGPPRMIEIFPGTHVRLRGADETWSAIRSDFYMPAVCLDCDVTVFCIEDAEFILCPHCRVISPLENSVLSKPVGEGGVGLGFTFEQLSRWQEEILQLRL